MGVPAALARPGSARVDSVNPERAPEDRQADGSYWWTFQRLLDAAKGDELGSAFNERQPEVRAAFDPLESAWRADVRDGTRPRPAHQRTHGRSPGRRRGARGVHTPGASRRALTTAGELLERFAAVAQES